MFRIDQYRKNVVELGISGANEVNGPSFLVAVVMIPFLKELDHINTQPEVSPWLILSPPWWWFSFPREPKNMRNGILITLKINVVRPSGRGEKTHACNNTSEGGNDIFRMVRGTGVWETETNLILRTYGWVIRFMEIRCELGMVGFTVGCRNCVNFVRGRSADALPYYSVFLV